MWPHLERVSHTGGLIPKPPGGLVHVNGSVSLWAHLSVCSGGGRVCVRVHVSVCRRVCDASGSRELPWSEQETTASGQGTGTVPEEVRVLVVQGTGRGTRLASPVTSLRRAADEAVRSGRARPGSWDVAKERSSRGLQEEVEGAAWLVIDPAACTPPSGPTSAVWEEVRPSSPNASFVPRVPTPSPPLVAFPLFEAGDNSFF